MFYTLLFENDAAIVAHTLEDIREMCKQIVQAATPYELTLNTNNTLSTALSSCFILITAVKCGEIQIRTKYIHYVLHEKQ